MVRTKQNRGEQLHTALATGVGGTEKSLLHPAEQKQNQKDQDD
jgi:hypothetical protein